MDILTFELDSRCYAFPAEHVVQVVQMVAISPLPGAPPVVEGVVNVRGTVVPVLDLRGRLGLPARPLEPAQNLIILAVDGRQAAVRVDAAEDVVAIPDSTIKGMDELSDAGSGASSTRHVTGIAATDDGTMIIYDLAGFLSRSEAESLDTALVSASG